MYGELHTSPPVKIIRRRGMPFWPCLLLTSNLAALVLTVVYAALRPQGSWGWNLYGVLLSAVFAANLGTAAFSRSSAKREYGYIAVFIASMLLLMIYNTAASAIPAYRNGALWIPALLLLPATGYGAYIARRIGMEGPGGTLFQLGDAPSPAKKLGRSAAVLLFGLTLGSGIYAAAEIVTPGGITLAEVFFAEYALFVGWIVLGSAAVLVKLADTARRPLLKLSAASAGILVFGVCLLPLFAAPRLVSDASEQYAQAFGKTAESVSAPRFRTVPFSLPAYYFGIPSEDYELRENLLFYEGAAGVDQGLRLYFDVYMPPAGQGASPRPVLIRIHGGGWTIGDKGAQNNAQLNKYFAAQGYVVFDIQYGLSDTAKFVKGSPVPDSRVGSFGINDMVRHIGVFTRYLADHAAEYGADPKTVFVSGASAGGQLAGAAALGLAGGGYGELMLDPRIQVKGLIPFYPANGLAGELGIPGSPELNDPALLVQPDSPPVLIYQGTHDGIVDPAIAGQLRQAYLDAGNRRAALLYMPFGGHGSDYYFAGPYTQAFIYYMERFMLQYR